MIHNVTSVEVSPRQMDGALDWIKRFYGYVKMTYGVQIQLMQPVTPAPGQARRIVIVQAFDSLAAWGAHKEKCAKDPQRNEFFREAEEKLYMVPNGNTITLYTVTAL